MSPVLPGRRRRREGGFSLLLLLALVAVASVCSIALLGRLQHLARERVRTRASDAAFWAAQGGVERARAALARDPGWGGGEAALGRGRVEVRVEPVEGEPDCRAVRSLGFDPGLGTEATAARRTVTAVLRLGDGPPRVVAWREEP